MFILKLILFTIIATILIEFFVYFLKKRFDDNKIIQILKTLVVVLVTTFYIISNM